MKRKIIGVTVGTPISPTAIEGEIKPIKTVNGQKPDANGNVEVDGSLPSVKADDNGKILQVVGGTWKAAELAVYNGEYEVVK